MFLLRKQLNLDFTIIHVGVRILSLNLVKLYVQVRSWDLGAEVIVEAMSGNVQTEQVPTEIVNSMTKRE